MPKHSAPRVRVYPTGDKFYVPGVPAVQFLLPADQADRLLRFGQAFTTSRPDDVELDPEPRESLDGLEIPGEPSEEPESDEETTTEGQPDGEPSEEPGG